MFIRETTRPEKEKKIDIYIGEKYAGIGNTTAHLRFNSLEINITQIWGERGEPNRCTTCGVNPSVKHIVYQNVDDLNNFNIPPPNTDGSLGPNTENIRIMINFIKTT